MSAHNLCFEQKYEKYQNFSSVNFHFLVVKFSVYLNRHVFVMNHITTVCMLTHFSLETPNRITGKQCRPLRSDAAECHI